MCRRHKCFPPYRIAIRIVKSLRLPPVPSRQHARACAGQSGHYPGEGDLTNCIHICISDIEIAGAIDRNVGGIGLKRATPPLPSALPITPAAPAMVETTPAGVILRMVWLGFQKHKRCLRYPPQYRRDSQNCAALPVPSALPLNAEVPASVVTTPAGVIFRIGIVLLR